MLAVMLWGCIEPDLVPCGDVACPVGMVCTPAGCATPEAAAACAGKPDHELCTTSIITDGACAGQACHPIVCGDRYVDRGERCDDGNVIGGDGCSATCDSDEVCGNGVVDAV